MSMAEAAVSIKQLKQLEPVHDAFVSTVGVGSWKEAREKYPQHTTDVRLNQFVGHEEALK